MILSSTINLLLNSKVVIRQIPLGHAHRSPSQQSTSCTVVGPGHTLTSHSGHAELQADHGGLGLGKLLGVAAVAIVCGAAALYGSKSITHGGQSWLLKTQGGFEGR